MKTLTSVIILSALVLYGCTAVTGVPPVDVEIINRSSHDLANVRALFGDYACEWGTVGKTFTAVYLFYPHPITADTELRWDEQGSPRVEKIDLRQVYRRGQAGKITFTVLDGRAEVAFRKE